MQCIKKKNHNIKNIDLHDEPGSHRMTAYV